MKYTIVINGQDTLLAEQISALGEFTTATLTDENPQIENELILGDTKRELTAEAKTILDKVLSGKPDGTVGYAIIKKRGSVAAVWSDFHLTEAVVSFLAEKIPEIEDGYNYSAFFPLMPYLEERGRALVDKKWKNLEEALGKEYGPAIVAATKELYKLFVDRRMVEWAASLYDAKVGGWYCSNSARDNEPFRPDIESTYVALSFIGSSGMSEMFGGDWAKAVPTWLKDKVAEFFISLQDEDSFFYHPQWPKEFIIENNHQARITRDRSTAIRVLKKLGREPKYSEPQKKADENAPRMLSQFESVENFKAYVKGLEEEALAIEDPQERAAKFYFYGNLFQSTTPYLNSNPEMKKIFIEFLEKHQNEDTGMWSDVVCYHGANGLHKIADTANLIGYKLKHIDKMVDSILEIINYKVEDKPAAGAVYIYNAWSCFPYIYENILKYGDGTEKERLERKTAIKNRVLAAAPSALRAAINQMQGFKRCEGGFSYSRYGSGGVSQRCPSAVKGTMESEINGNSIAVTALKLYIFKALELSEDYIPPVFTEYERMMYMDILERLNREAN